MKHKITEILRNYQKRKITDANMIPSAVLIPLFCREGQCHMLFTERSSELSSHKGQVCFPGGASQPGDSSLLHTALREAEEEIGLKPEDVEIIAELDDITTVSTGYVISPFVAFIPYPYPFKVNHQEITEVFSVPLSFLVDRDHLKKDCQISDSQVFTTPCYQYAGHVIWGATSRILRQLIEITGPESGTCC
jgi:8-oxo-dGTP pyrophosphatase MutT (NUDIX family)